MLVPARALRAAVASGTARLSHDSAVPRPLSRHGGTIRHGTANMPCRVVPCLAGPCLSVPVPVPCRAADLANYIPQLDLDGKEVVLGLPQ